MTPTSSERLVLVTGGAGFIGSHLIEQLVARGDRVIVADNLSTGRRSNLDSIDPAAVTFIEGDVRSVLPGLRDEPIDEIYHLAAAVGVRLVIEQPIHTIETNVLETSAILEFASSRGVPTLVASTSEVYGKSTKMPFAEDDDVVYGPTIYARWSYACSKAMDEYLALAHHGKHDLPVSIIRFFNTVGPRQVGHYGMVLPRFVTAALANETIEVHGDGEQTRCFCDVRDVVKALPRVLAEEKCHGRVFNLGSDRSIAIRELAELVCKTLGSSSQIVTVSYEEAFGPGFDDLRHRRPCLDRIRDAIGFNPVIPLEQTIADLADNIRGKQSASVEHSA